MQIPAFLRRLALLLRRDRATRELEEEMRLHRELRAATLSGVDVAAAARRRFGNPLQHAEASRDAWGWTRLDELRQDLHYAARRLRQRPGFALSVIVVLALGIGATTAMFSAVDAAMLRPLPFPHPEELVTLPSIEVPIDAAAFGTRSATAYHMVSIVDIGVMHSTFSHAAAWASGGLNLSDAERPVRLNVGVVTSDFFATMGIAPVVGRTFLPAEGRPGGADVAVLSYALWQSHYGGSAVTNRTIMLNEKPYLVIGVMPRGFSFPARSDIWIPMPVPTTMATFEPFRGFLSTNTIARLQPGVSMATASKRLMARWQLGIGAAARSGNPRYLREVLRDLVTRGVAIPLQSDLGADRRSALLILLGATLLLLLIACANVTNLLLSQATARRQEMAVREILGARHGRLVRQLLTESVLLACLGTGFGLALTPVVLHLLQPMMPSALAQVAPARVDIRVLSFAAFVGLMTGVVFGTWPALRFGDGHLGEAARLHGDRGATTRRAGARGMVVSFELALTTLLLIGTVLMLRSFEQLMDVDVGVHPEHVGTLELSFVTLHDTMGVDRRRRMHEVIARLDATPGITTAAFVNNLPLSGNGGMGLSVTPDDGARSNAKDDDYSDYLIASGDYFRAMGVSLRGRSFLPGDSGAAPGSTDRTPEVAVINTTMARRYWPGTDPIGHTFTEATDGPPIRVIGVVDDVRMTGLDRPADPQMYFPLDYETPRNVVLVARGTLPDPALLVAMRNAVHAVAPNLPVFHLRSMTDVLNGSVSSRRTNTTLITLFGGLALILSCFGVYALAAATAVQRRREFGIRSALGATMADLLGLAAFQSLVCVAIGIIAGTAAAWALTRVMVTLLYGVTAHDRATFIGVPLLLVLPPLIATLLPARRAARVNPAEVMRTE